MPKAAVLGAWLVAEAQVLIWYQVLGLQYVFRSTIILHIYEFTRLWNCKTGDVQPVQVESGAQQVTGCVTTLTSSSSASYTKPRLQRPHRHITRLPLFGYHHWDRSLCLSHSNFRDTRRDQPVSHHLTDLQHRPYL